ncbi:hypothetical protein EMCRGX_G023103 [Ephydatia muelleri]
MSRVNEDYVTTPSTGAASHVTTPSAGAASHVTTPSAGAASHVTTSSAGAASHVNTSSAGDASKVTTPSAGAASHVTTSSAGDASKVTTPSAGAASHVTTPSAGAASHVTTSSAGDASKVTTPSAGAASHVTTPSAGDASKVTTPSAGAASHVTTPSAGAASKGNASTAGKRCQQKQELRQQGISFDGDGSVEGLTNLLKSDEEVKKTPRGEGTTVRSLDYQEVSSHDQEIKILSRETCLYNWTHGGIMMEVPSGCLPEDVAECRLKVAASLGTDILLPEDTTLVSAVYHIITPPNVKRLKKPVTIHIQHCAGLKPGEEDKLSFVVAKEGATKFEFLPGGHFSSAHGSITLHSFSLLAIVSDMLYGSTYCGCIYYTNIEPDGSHEVHIVVIKKLSLAFQIVSEEYQVEMHHQKLLKFETNQIVLKLPDCSPDGWKLIPILLEVDKDEVDYFIKGLPLPRFQLHVRKTSPDSEPKRNYYTVQCLKTQKETSFVLLCPPPPALPLVNNDNVNLNSHMNSEDLVSLAECFLSSAATAADPAVRPASERRDGFSGEVTERSKAAVLPQSQFEAKMGSKGCSGHNAQGGEPGEVSSPSHNLMAIWCSLGSRLRPRPGDGQCQRAMQKHGEKTQTGDEPCQK